LAGCAITRQKKNLDHPQLRARLLSWIRRREYIVRKRAIRLRRLPSVFQTSIASLKELNPWLSGQENFRWFQAEAGNELYKKKPKPGARANRPSRHASCCRRSRAPLVAWLVFNVGQRMKTKHAYEACDDVTVGGASSCFLVGTSALWLSKRGSLEEFGVLTAVSLIRRIYSVGL